MFALLLAVAMLFSVMPINAIAVTTTNVNEDGYIEVRTIEDLYNIRKDMSAKYILMNDIDLTFATAEGGGWDFMGNGWNPIGSGDVYGNNAFSGIFDGNNNKIIGLRIDITVIPSGTSNVYAGLFSNVTGTVKNLTLTGSIKYSGSKELYVGSVAGISSGTIENCHSKVSASAEITIYGCDGYAGGIVGKADSALISNCSNYGNVKITTYSEGVSGKTDYKYSGGIAGYGGTITKCYNTGEVYAKASLGRYYGSGTSRQTFFGYAYAAGISNSGTISDSYNSGKVVSVMNTDYSTSSASGIGGKATNCYNTGKATGAVQYGIAASSCTNCYYLDGTGNSSTGAVALTEAQLSISSMFDGFDFDSVWVQDAQALYSYPQLLNNVQDLRVIESIEVTESPNKTTYAYGESLNIDGCKIKLNFKNGNEIVVVTKDMVSGYNATQPGVQQITITYLNHTTSFAVKVNEKVFVPIYTVADLYNVRDNLSANYILMNDIDLTEATAVGGDWDYDGRGWNPIGSNNVYAGGEFSGEFDGNGYSIIGMRIAVSSNSMPSGYSNSLYAGLFANSTGYVHDLNMENVDIYIYDNLSSTAWYAGAVCGNNGGDISNCSSSGRISVPYFDDWIGGITGYNKGNIIECFNISEVVEGKRAGGITGYNYNSGSVMNCYNAGIIHSNSDSNYHNESAGGITGYNAGAIENCYNSGMIKGSRDKYAIAYNYNGSILNSYYLVNSGTGATNCVSLSEAQMKSTASFRGFDFEKVWVLNEFANHPYPQLRNNIQDMSESASLVSIIAPPIKTTYYVGDKLDLTDGIVKVAYVSGKEEIKNITADMLSGFDMSVAGEQDVVVSIAGASDTYTITVKERPVVESIEITSGPDKSVFAVGTAFDFTGAKAFVTYVGGESETVSLTTENTTGYNINHVGKQTIVFALGGKSASFEIEVVGVEIEKIVLTALPDKLDFIEGQELDLTGMVVTAVMNNGFENIIAEGYTVSGYSNVPGTYEITIAYREKTATFNVTVAKKKLVSLGLNSLPDKLEYVSGQEFNANGMQIIATYDNGDIVIAEDYTISGFDSVPGIKNVVISLDDKSVSFPVKVIARVW